MKVVSVDHGCGAHSEAVVVPATGELSPPVVDEDGCCAGIIAQADIASVAPPRKTAELLSEVSRATGRQSQ